MEENNVHTVLVQIIIVKVVSSSFLISSLTFSVSMNSLIAPSVIAIQSSLKGLRKLLLNEKAIYADLDNCWSVLAEAIQTILRREAYPHPYEALKAFSFSNSLRRPFNELWIAITM